MLPGRVSRGQTPALSALAGALVIFAWNEILSIFPATVAATFGTAYATVDGGLLYTAKGVAAFRVPRAGLARQRSGHWDMLLVGAAAVNLAAGRVAKGRPQPLCRRRLARLR